MLRNIANGNDDLAAPAGEFDDVRQEVIHHAFNFFLRHLPPGKLFNPLVQSQLRAHLTFDTSSSKVGMEYVSRERSFMAS